MTRGTFGAGHVAAEFPSSLAGTETPNARGGAALRSGPPPPALSGPAGWVSSARVVCQRWLVPAQESQCWIFWNVEECCLFNSWCSLEVHRGRNIHTTGIYRCKKPILVFS